MQTTSVKFVGFRQLLDLCLSLAFRLVEFQKEEPEEGLSKEKCIKMVVVRGGLEKYIHILAQPCMDNHIDNRTPCSKLARFGLCAKLWPLPRAVLTPKYSEPACLQSLSSGLCSAFIRRAKENYLKKIKSHLHQLVGIQFRTLKKNIKRSEK